MNVLVDLLIWAHLLALALGTGAGLGMSQVGPRLIAAAPDQRATWWPLAKAFNRISGAALVVLLVTGPLLLWLKWDGGAGLSVWFAAKMGLVALAVITIGLGKWGMGRLARGDEAGGRLMAVAGPLTFLVIVAVVLTAVFAFH